MKKRILSVLLCIVMVLSLVPTVAFAADTAYDVWVNGEQFTSDKLSIACGSGTATLDATTTPYTLTLDDATITATLHESFGNAAVYTDTDLNVVLKGENTITVNQSSDSGFYARNAALTLEGEGSLTVSAKDSGIYMSGTAAKTVTLGGSGKLEITGESAGIYSEKGVTVVFSNTNSTPVSIVASDEYGIWSVNGDITLSGTGDANIHALNTAVYVFDTGDVTFSGSGNLALEGGHEVNSTANGIYVQNGDVKFTGTGGQVSVTGDGDVIYLGTSGKKVYLNGSASPITLTAGEGYIAVKNLADSDVVNDTNDAYNVEGGPAAPSAVYTLKVPLTDYYITVNDIPVTSLNKDDVLGNGKVSYDSVNDKLSVSAFSGALTIVGNDTVDIKINGGSTNAVTGKLTVSKAHDVSASSESSYPTISSDVSIDCTGDVVIENIGTSLSVAGNLTVANANNVTVRNTSTDNISPVISGTVDITCTGDVLLETAGTGFVTGALTVKKAKNVTVLGNSTSPMLTGSAEIACTGDLSMTNNGVSTGSITVHNAKDVTICNTNALATSQVVTDKLDITCTGNVLLENAGTGFVVGRTLDVQGAKNVTARSNSATPTIQGVTDIACTGDVVIENKGNSLAAGAKMTVSGAKNVTVSSASTSPTTNGVEITCTGDLAITNSGTGMVCGGSVTVHSARNVTIHNTNPSSTYQVMNGITDISSSGDVLIQTSGSGYAVNNNITYTRIAGAGGYAVRTGDTEATLTTVATKAENEVYSSENCEKNILNIVPAYTVTVQNDGNGTASANKTSAVKGETVTLTATPSTGYHFKEWQSSDVTVSSNTFTMPEKDVTVKAIFEADAPTAYTVSFNMNGHGNAPAAQTVNEGSKATKPADPTAEGWTFDGWHADANFSEAFDFNTAITADTTVYAKWTENTVPQPPVPTTYTVTFNMNGHGAQISAQSVESGNKAAKPTDPTAEGWTFSGWYADATFNVAFDFDAAINANTTVYAKWTEVKTDNPTDPTNPTNPADPTNPANPTNPADPTNLTDPTNPTSPQTGDNSHMFLWIALLFISGGVLVGTTVYGRKKKYNAD